MTKFLTIISSALFLWVFWNASTLGVYVGTYTSKADGQEQCRYITARGLADEPQEEAVSPRNLNSKWCPTTRVFGINTDARRKANKINTASGL